MTKRAGRTELRANHIAIAVAAAFAPWSLHAQTPPAPNTLPTGGVITHGSGTINAPVHTPTLSTMQIDQTSARMAAQFGSFSIGESAHVNVTQPSSSSIALFKDVGGSVSQIYGRLTANGQLFVANPDGVLIGRTGRVEAAGFIASTLTLDANEFMLGGNSFNWINIGARGRITNEGTIFTPNGYTMLAGPQVRNDGLIIANRGSVVLAAGDRVSLDLIGDGLISVSVDQAALNASVINTGTLQADGGTVMLKASSANALLDTVINTSGIVRANSLVAVNGEIILDGGGAVQVAGTVEAIGGAINVSADSSLNVGSTVCCAPTQVTAGTQTIEAGSITVGGGASVTTTSGSQTVTTPGTLLVRGGVLSGGVGLFHNGSGEQRISAGSLELRGGSGTNTGAFINSNAGGDQVVTVSGALTITGGASGTGNRAGLVSTGAQTINGNPDIVLSGGSGGGSGNASNNVFIQATGPDTKPQTINARSIRLNAGTGPDASATLNAARQVITTIGDVSVFGSGGPGGSNGARIGGIGGTTLGPTNLTLNVGGSVLLHGGSANGASLGSSGASTQANTITVNAAGNITLESEGAGARIGSSNQAGATPGNIAVTAGESLELGSGTAVRANGPITLTADSLSNDGTITNGGGANTPNIILSANAFDLAGGNVQGGAAAVVLRPRDGTRSFGIEAAGDTTLTNADIASFNTSNFVVFGSGTGTIFTGNMTIGQNAQVDGGTKNLAFFRSSAPGGTTTIGSQGVTTTGDAIVSAGGGAIVSNGGMVSADEVQLRASQGIGSALAPVKTNANALAVNNAGSGGVFVSELNNVTLRTISLNVGGNLNTASNSNSGSFSLVSGGDVNVAGLVSSAGSMILDAGGNLKLDGSLVDAVLMSNGGQTIIAQSIELTAQNGRRANIENTNGNQSVTATAGDVNLQVPGGFGVAQIINTATGGNQTVHASGQLKVLGGVITPTTSRNSGIFKNGPGGLQTVSASGITLQGASTSTSAGALISSQSDQFVDVTGGTINIFGGNGGTINNAAILASASGQQTIRAHDINLANGFGGTDTVAAIQAGHQDIHATGNVTLTSQGALLGTAAGGPGVRIGAPQNTAAGSDLKLRVGGNLTLNGGTVAENAASIGSSGAGVAAPNKITIEAGGSVMLNAGTEPGTGVRIGSGSNGTAGGDISIKAGGTIAMNGTARSAAIRTLDDVTLEAASISQGSNGFILADTLTTRTIGAANLTGPNEINAFNATSGGALTLVDAGGLRVTGIGTSNDAITLTTDSLSNVGVITNGGPSSTANIVLNADAFNLAAGTVEGGAAAVIVRPKTGTNSFGIESAAATTLTNADIASINTSDFVVFGSGMGTTFTGNMTIGQNGQVNGGGKNLAFFRSSVPGGSTTIGAGGVGTTGNVIVSAGGGSILSNGGTVSGDQVQLRASQGIGSAAARVQTNANALAINNTGSQGAFVSEADSVTLRNVNLVVGGIVNNVANSVGGGGVYDVAANGSITVGGPISALSGLVNLSANGFGATLSETDGGLIQTGSLTTFSQGATTLTGPNQVQSFNGSTGFDADLSLDNSGALSITGLFVGGDFTLANSGAVSVTGPSFAFGAMDIATAGGNLTLTNSLSSGGAMTLDVDGTLTVSANGLQTAQLNSNNGQTIKARSVEVLAQNGGFALISNFGSGDQSITATGGNIDVQVLNAGGSAQISTHPAGNQTIRVVDGDRVNIDGARGNAAIFGGGTQTVSITGSGANAITIGSVGARGASNIGGGLHQVVTAGLAGERGSITIVGPDVGGALAGLVSNPVAGGTQTVSTAGTIRVTGGRAAPQLGNFQSGIFHNGSGLQTVNAASIELQGGPSGASNGAFISVLGGGVAANAGAQTINVTGDISIAGGAGGNAAISNLGTRKQTILADNISLTNAASGGNNSGGFITGPQQEIHATGNVTLTARASGGDLPGVRIGSSSTATNLELFVGGDLVLTGGTAVNNGVGIGSSGSGTPLANNIKIEAGGSVILNAGELQNTGARIGSGSSGTAGGNISIKAGGSIQLNGTQRSAAIRTLDDVMLDAASVSETGNASIIAGTLNLHTTGDALLNGANQVGSLSAPGVAGFPGMPTMPSGQGIGGNLAFTNSSALNLSNVSVGGTLTLNNTASVAVSNAVTSGGAMNLDVAGDIAVTAGGLQDATLSAFGGQTINARSLAVTSSDGRFASVSNNGGAQSITLSNGAGLDVSTQAFGGFAQVRNDGGGSQTISVVNGDHINVNGAQGFAGIVNSGGTQTLSITGSGSRNAITVGSTGAVGASNVGGGFTQNVTAGLAGEQGSITIVGADAQGAGAGFVTNPNVDGTQTVSTSGTISVTGGRAVPLFGNLPAGIFHNGTGQQTINAARIELTGGSTGSNNAALINVPGGNVAGNAAAQVVNVTGDILIAGGAGGNAGIIGSSVRQQTVNAANISVTNSAGGGTNSVGFIEGGHQQINATGDVLLTGRASGGDLAGVRIGGRAGNNPTATDLTLNVGRDLILTGGTAPNNGVGIGSTAAPGVPPLRNDITINAGRDVTLNAGVATSGVRIGSPQAGVTEGSINITAGGNISLNGVNESASIRTLGTATLRAASIAEAVQGRIIAGTLSTNTSGRTLLTGPNEIANFSGSSLSDLTLNNTGALNVTGMNAFGDATINNIGDVTVSGPWNAGGTSTITVGSDIRLNSAMVSERVVLNANDGAIIQAPTASIVADSLTTSSTGDTLLDGVNQVETIRVSSTAGDVRLTTSSPVLTIASIDLPGELLVRHTGAVNVRGEVSALAHDISATGDVTVGSADSQSATLLYARGDISIATPGSILVRGSDTTAGASSAVLADGQLRFSAGNVTLRAGDAALTPVVVRGANGVQMTVGNELKVTGGRGLLSPALLSSGRDIELTIGQAVRVDGGSGLLSIARVQTETVDGEIRITFPNLSDGGYFVNGLEGHRHNHDSGFYSMLKPAKVGKTLLLEYAD